MPVSRGFSLVEVMVGLVITCVGVLGMMAMQGRSIQQTQSAVNQNQAILLADNLLELMRSNPDGALTDDQFTTASAYYKASGSTFSSGTASSCLSRDRSAGGSSVASADVACWLQDVQSLLPVDSDVLGSSFTICPSAQPDTCTTAASAVVMIQIAWVDRTGQCADNICTYRLRSEL
jgi:type IV pilus assembly protein PilV